MVRVTDEERREIVRRLRDRLKTDGIGGFTSGEFGNAVYFSVMHGHRGGYGEAGSFLADLIEPSDRNDELCAHCDYHDYCDLPKCSEQDGYSFKPKGYVDLLVLADTIRETSRHDMEMCGDTVPAWYAAGRIENIARRIREILEVES